MTKEYFYEELKSLNERIKKVFKKDKLSDLREILLQKYVDDEDYYYGEGVIDLKIEGEGQEEFEYLQVNLDWDENLSKEENEEVLGKLDDLVRIREEEK